MRTGIIPTMKARRVDLREVRVRLHAIRAVSYDVERAQELEDALWLDVLHTIATVPNGAVSASELASEALKSRRIKRGCA